MKKTLLTMLFGILFFSCAEKMPDNTKGSTVSDPYVIGTPADFAYVRSKIAAGATVYIELSADIDMESVKDYVPFNNDEPYDKTIHFDGKGYTISNFTCSAGKYPSLFGVLQGSCKNLNMDNVNISGAGECGALAAYVGTENRTGVVENVSVKNANIINSNERAGGVCGNVTSGTFKDVSFQGIVKSTFVTKEAKTGGFVGQVESYASFENCSVDVEISARQSDLGGFAGKVMGTASFTGCNVKAVVLSEAALKNRVGGFIGWNSSVKTTLYDCHVLEGSSLTDASGRISTATNGNYGGFIGFGDTNGTVLNVDRCSAAAVVDGGVSTYNAAFISFLGYASTVTVTNSHATGDVKSKTGNYAGGLFGCVGANANLTMSDCYYSGNVDVTGGYVGGIIGGVSGKLTLTRTYSMGTVTAVGAYVGGLIGASMNDGVNISDCFSLSKVHGRGQQVGGLVGTTTNKLTMSCCYASGDVYSGTSGAAGLVGRVQKSSVITDCIAWNRTIGCSRGASNVYAPGAILGCAQEAGTYKGCWRRADMVLTDDYVTLYDQEDFVNAAPPLPSYSSETHQQSYHGKAALPGATLASVAQSLGWNADVWNFDSADSFLGFAIKQLGDNKIEF